MPLLYRSRSLRRFNEANSRLASIIENHTTKIVAAASIQLFVSTHQLEKWFKSSTGTLCFLKDINLQSVYYFRLYSLMQGQLWEQEIQAPFVYKKLSPIFHYLTINRYNFGFKFICEDESERFYSAITKFSYLLRPPILKSVSQLNKSKNIAQNLTKPPSGSVSNSSSHSFSSFSDSLTETLGPTKAHLSNFLCHKPESTKLGHKPRRIFHSSDRSAKQTIRTSDISCPFRCSRKDLNSSRDEAIQNIYKKDVSSSSSPSCVTVNKPQKFEPTVQRTRSTASIPNNKCRLSICDVPLPRLHSSVISSSQSSYSLTSIASLDSQRLLVDASSANTTLKNKERPSPSQKSNKLTHQNVEDLELEATKQILIQYDVAINRKIVKELHSYISNYGGIEKFQESLKMESERNKLNLFISSHRLCEIKTMAPPSNLNDYVDHIKKASEFKNSENYKNCPNVNSPLDTPYTTINSKNSKKSSEFRNKTQYSCQNTLELTTFKPVRCKNVKQQNLTDKKPVPQPELNRTPIRLPNHLTNFNNRDLTPSPSRNSHHLKQHNMGNITSTPNSFEAPPKPPRHTSLKAVNEL